MPKALLLISGGFDSPVAGSVLLGQELQLEAVHFSNKLAGKEPGEKCKKLARILGIQKLWVCEIGPALAKIAQEAEPRDYFVLMKRLMLRAAERLAKQRSCAFLATGENLGQVSSQTLTNLEVIDKATSMVVLRPLVGWDKQEIIDRAKKIGTHDASVGPECCDILGPAKAGTRARLEKIVEQEERLGVGKIAQGLEFEGL